MECGRPLDEKRVEGAIREWLETQSRITGYWREMLVAQGGDHSLIRALDEHAAFLLAAAHVDEGKYTAQQ